MTRKEEVFKALWHKHAENVLAFIYTSEIATFDDICDNFSYLSENTVRKIVNNIVRAKLIKSIKHKNRFGDRGRAYIISDENTTIKVLELDI